MLPIVLYQITYNILGKKLSHIHQLQSKAH